MSVPVPDKICGITAGKLQERRSALPLTPPNGGPLIDGLARPPHPFSVRGGLGRLDQLRPVGGAHVVLQVGQLAGLQVLALGHVQTVLPVLDICSLKRDDEKKSAEPFPVVRKESYKKYGSHW